MENFICKKKIEVKVVSIQQANDVIRMFREAQLTQWVKF